MVYTLGEVCRRMQPVAGKYHLKVVYVFGSYTRGDAREDSDVDLLVGLAGAKLSDFFAVGGFYNDLEAAPQKEIGLITAESLEQPGNKASGKLFRDVVNQERREIYAVVRFATGPKDPGLLLEHIRYDVPFRCLSGRLSVGQRLSAIHYVQYLANRRADFRFI